MILKLTKNNTITSTLLLSLLGVAVFNMLPVLFPGTASFAFVFVFCFTFLFIYKLLFSTEKFKTSLQTNFFYVALLLWTVIMCLRGFEFNYDFYRSLVISPYVLLPYLLPLTVNYFNFSDFKNILTIIHVTNGIYLIFIALYFIQPGNDILLALGFVEDASKYLAFPNFLMLFSIQRLTRNQKILSLIVFFVGFLIAVYTARRSLTWVYGCASVLLFYLRYINTKGSFLKKIRFFFLMGFLSFAMYIGYVKYEHSLFGNLIEKLDLDSRGTVLRDFERDMQFGDLIFGRGLNGKYKLVETDPEINADYSSYRNIIESGYLNILLKGGYIYLLLILAIYLKAIYNGLFKSKNNFAKIFACFVLLHIFEAYPAGILTFNMRFVLIWFCIAMCWNSRFLNAKNNELELILKKTN